MKLVFFGTPEFAVPSLAKLLAQPEVEILGVVTQPDKRRGRGNQLTPSPVKALALERGLSIWAPSRIKRDAETLDALRSLHCDAFVVIAYGQILSPEILAMPRLGCINAHGSILPRYRGAAPIQWCLHNGEPETGITTMLMDAGMDTGPMLLEVRTPIDPQENADQLAQRLAQLSADLLVTTLDHLDRGLVIPRAQDEHQATYAPLIQKTDYALDWNWPAIALHNKIRGFYPHCVTSLRGEPLKILASAVARDLTSPMMAEAQPTEAWAQPGRVVGLLPEVGPLIQAGQGLLILQEVQPAGKKRQSGIDLMNGLRLEPGEVLGL